MWFKRKAKNRRLGRDQVLDVKLRSSQVRAARTRTGAVALGAVFAITFSLYLAYRTADWGLNRLVYENKAFAVLDIDVQTDGVISLDELRRWTGVKPGANLLAPDLARVKRDLELVPLVQSISVERILPHTLRIRVTEREPIAQINVPRPRRGGGVELAVYQLDADGYVMVPMDPRQRATLPNQPGDVLPAIGGINSSELQPGRRISAPQVQVALRLLIAFEQSPMAGLVDLRRVDVSSPEVLVVTTGQGGEVTFGLADLEQQLRRWRDIFDVGQTMSKAIGTLDLAVTNNIPARWLEASAVPPVAPKSAKPLHLRKKHV